MSDKKMYQALPPDVALALDAHGTARAVFEDLPPSHRREYLNWIDEARKPETRAGRIGRMISILTEDGGSE